MQHFVRKSKFLNLGLKMSYLGIFRLKFEKIIVRFEINTLKVAKMQKLPFWVFLCYNFEKLLRDFTSAFSNLSKGKILGKNKNA